MLRRRDARTWKWKRLGRPVGEYINELIATARETFRDVQVTRRDERSARALIDMEGWWGAYRIIISEIILLDGSIRRANARLLCA